MELLQLSKFKVQLQALITHVKQLRERDRSSSERVELLIKKQNQTDEDYGAKLHQLHADLASSIELCQNLQRKVDFLQSDNMMLENKHKELKGTIQNLLQSRESFVNAYKESTGEMRRTIEARDRNLSILSERINSHLSLFDAIEKEAFSIKQLVDNTQCLVAEKEGLVAGLRSRMEEISAIEKALVEKICALENKLKHDEDELRMKDNVVAELKVQLEAAKVRNACHTQVEDMQKALSAKDILIQSLISDKEALHFQVGSLGAILQKIHDSVAKMNGKDKRMFSLILEQQERCGTVDDNSVEDAVSNSRGKSPRSTPRAGGAKNTASSCRQKYSLGAKRLLDNKNTCSDVSELSSDSLLPACSENQFANVLLSISGNDE